VHARVQEDSPIGISAGSSIDDEPPDEENGDVVIDVQESLLSRTLLEDHDKRVTEIQNLRHIKDPQDTRKPSLFWIVFEIVAIKAEMVDEDAVFEHFENEPPRQCCQHNVVEQLEEFWFESIKIFHDHVSQDDHGEVSQNDQNDVERVHEWEITRQR